LIRQVLQRKVASNVLDRLPAKIHSTNPDYTSTVNLLPLLRQPPLIYDKLTITRPSPNHVQDTVSFGGLNNKRFNTLKAEIPLDTTPELLKMLAKKMGRTLRGSRQINTQQLTIPRLGFITPTGQPLKHTPLLTRPRFENGLIAHSYTQPLGAFAPFQCLELSDT
jgi:hypothetical protein